MKMGIGEFNLNRVILFCNITFYKNIDRLGTDSPITKFTPLM